MTQIFANRPELMPIGETTQEHKEWQEEEAALVEKDRASTGLKGGLFRGCFRLIRRRQLAAIRDDEDGVDRCPRCTWELEDGLCESCGFPDVDDSAELSDPDVHGPWDGGLSDMDGATIEDLVGALGDEARMDGRMSDLGFSEHGYTSEDASYIGSAPRMHQRDRRVTAQLNRLRELPEEEPTYDSFLDDTDEDSENDETGSLDDFIVNEDEDGPHSFTSSTRSLQWETDEGTDGEAHQLQTSDNGQHAHGEDGLNETTFAAAQYGPEHESDEGPILRSRRQVRRRSVASRQSSGSDGNGGSGISQTLNTLRVRNGYNRSRVSANPQRNIPHRNPHNRREGSAGGPIELGSDSDSPVPAQHTRRRRRAIPDRLPSNDESEVEASSGTATVGRDSPRPVVGWIGGRNGGIRTARHTSNASSPIPIDSSPTSPTDGQLAVPGAFPQRSQPHVSLDVNHSQHNRRAPAPAHRGEDDSFRGASSRRPPANASPSNGLQQRQGPRRRSPFPPRTHPHSPTDRQSHSPTAMEIFEQGRRERQARKIERRAERRRLKAEREQRGRPQSGLSLSPGSPNHYEEPR